MVSEKSSFGAGDDHSFKDVKPLDTNIS